MATKECWYFLVDSFFFALKIKWDEFELFGESNCVITVKEVVNVLDSDKAQKTYSQLSVNLQIKV